MMAPEGGIPVRSPAALFGLLRRPPFAGPGTRKGAGAAASYDGLHDAAQGAFMLSVTVRRETMPLPPVRGVKRDMPRGDAARIRAYAVGLVADARAAGESGVTVRAGDVREALELDYRKALINICQVLGTRKLQGEAGVELVARRGPRQGLNSVFEFRLVGGGAWLRTPEAVSPVLEAPVNRPEGARPSGRGASVCLDRGFRRALRRVGTLRGRTVRT